MNSFIDYQIVKLNHFVCKQTLLSFLLIDIKFKRENVWNERYIHIDDTQSDANKGN